MNAPRARRSFVRKHATAIVLVALTSVAAAVVFLVDSGTITSGEAEARKTSLIPAWRADDITRLELKGADESYALSRPAKGVSPRPWSLELADKVLPAEEQAVDRLLSTLEYARFSRQVPEGSVDRAAFGLSPPSSTLTLSMGELGFVLKVGATTPAKEGVYVEVEGRGVFVITPSLASALWMRSSELRSTAFVPYLSTELSGLELSGEGGTRKFERAPWGGGRGSGFRFAAGSEGPVGERVDGLALDHVLVAFGKMQAEQFLTEEQAQQASKPRVEIKMVPAQGEPGLLSVGGACPDKPGFVVVVRSSPSYAAVCVPETVTAPLLKPASDFEDDGMIGASVDEIVELTIQQGDKVLDLARFGEGFKVRKPEERTIPADVGNALLKDIVDARGKRAPQGTAKPSGEVIAVRVKSQGGVAPGGGPIERSEELEIAVGATGGEQVVLRKEDGTMWLLGSGAASALRPSDLLLREQTILELSTLDVEELSIERGADKQRFKRKDAGYELLEPKGAGVRADDGFAGAAVTTLATLEAVRWVAEAPEPAFGLSEPRFKVSAKLSADPNHKDRPKSVVLLLGARSDDGTYAMVDHKKGVFLVKREVETAFDRSLVARDAFNLDTSTADKIELSVGNKKVVLVRDGRQLRIPGGSDARAAELDKALVQMSAIRALTVGPPAPDHGFERPAFTALVTRRKSGAGDGTTSKQFKLMLGVGDTVDGVGIRYARRDDVDATYLVSLAAAARVISLVEGP